MLYDAKISMRLPGDTPDDAVARLRSKLPPGWDFTIIGEIVPAPEQPARIVGTLNIALPGVAARGK